MVRRFRKVDFPKKKEKGGEPKKKRKTANPPKLRRRKMTENQKLQMCGEKKTTFSPKKK